MKDIDKMFLDACHAGKIKYVEFFIAHGADVNASDDCGWTILHDYAGLHCSDGLRMTGTASKEEELAITEILFKNSINVNARTKRDGATPLHIACTCGNMDFALQLIDHGANIGEKDNYGHSILHETIRLGWITVAQLLISKGAEFTQEDREECGKLCKEQQLKSLQHGAKE